MHSDFKGHGNTCLVVIALNEHANVLLNLAIDLCSATGMSLHILHVVEPVVFGYPLYEFGLGIGDGVQSRLESEALSDAKDRLNDIVTKIAGPTAKVIQKVVTANITDGVLEEVESLKPALVICGAAPGSHRLVPTGISVALSLMSESKVPVIVIPEGSELYFSRGPVKALVSDDLREESAVALGFAYNLLAKCNKGTLRHVHVNSLSLEILSAALATGMAAAHLGASVGADASSVLLATNKIIDQKLEARFKAVKDQYGASSCKYESEVLNGQVVDRIDEEVSSFKPDLCVFGRHRTVRRRPFTLGNVSFRTMLSQGRPIMIVPPQA